MARRGRKGTAGQYAARELRRLVLQLVFAAVVLVLFIYVVAPPPHRRDGGQLLPFDRKHHPVPVSVTDPR